MPGTRAHRDRTTGAVLVRSTPTAPGDLTASGARESGGRRMNGIDVADTLADLVTENPGRASVLERYHLDYCCHGNISLEEACKQSALDPDAVVAELLDIGRPHTEDWRALPVDQLVDHIEQAHHAYLHEELP